MPVKVLNQAVKRNIDRFPDDFMFQLTLDEAEAILRSRSQIVTLKPFILVIAMFIQQHLDCFKHHLELLVILLFQFVKF